jgi:DinB superfamily
MTDASIRNTTVAQSISGQFDIHARVLSSVLKDITHEQSLQAPPGGGNCANWILAHIVHHRNHIHRLIGIPIAHEASADERFGRGGTPTTNSTNALKWSDLITAFDGSQTALTKRLKAVSNNELAATDGKGTVEDTLRFLLFHEAYHIGQLGLLRRTLGLPGGIK